MRSALSLLEQPFGQTSGLSAQAHLVACGIELQISKSQSPKNPESELLDPINELKNHIEAPGKGRD